MDCSFEISVISQYLDEQSVPAEGQFVFAYTVKIHNRGDNGAQLLRRHWIITDANGTQQVVRGEGVIGEQPVILPGETYSYTSGAILNTPLGSMQGRYQMVSDSGEFFDIAIPRFTLNKPGILN